LRIAILFFFSGVLLLGSLCEVFKATKVRYHGVVHCFVVIVQQKDRVTRYVSPQAFSVEGISARYSN
jgi:hypothetical protein